MTRIDRSHMDYWRPELLKFLREYDEQYGYMPSLADMANRFNVSTSTILFHMRKLDAARLIKRVPYSNRAVRLTERGLKESMKA